MVGDDHPHGEFGEDEASVASSSQTRVAAEVIGVTRAFGGTIALRDVTLAVHAGEIHGLVGQNGAGKSTLCKVITGAHDIDEGQLRLFEQPCPTGDPRATRARGVTAIYQELTTVPNLHAAANVFLGHPARVGPLLSRAQTRREYDNLAARLGVTTSWSAKAGELSVADRQMLEVMRAMAADHRVMIMDEPTSSLGPRERARLFEVIRELKRSGVAVIYVSHALEEVLAVCDRVSVMRDGRLIATRPAHAWSSKDIVEAMVGEALATVPRAARHHVGAREKLRVHRLTTVGGAVPLTDVSLTLREGEILGLGGLVGSGRSELLRALAGADPVIDGHLELDQRAVRWPRSVREALALGIALAPEDRKGEGLVLSLSSAANVVISDVRRCSSGPLLRRTLVREHAVRAARSVGFDTARLGALAGTLSGGNQQKLMLARRVHRRPQVLLLDEPTRGIDVGAKREVYNTVQALAADGTSIILASSELEEVVDLSDRVVVLAKGRTVATLAASQASVARILNLIFATEAPARADSATGGENPGDYRP